MAGHGARAARLVQRRQHLLAGTVGQQVEMDHRATVLGDALADRRRQRVDQAAFHALRRDHELALAGGQPVDGDSHRLDRRAGELLREERTPAGHLETAVARRQRRHGDAARCQQRHPGTVRAELRPAAAAQGQHAGVGLQRLLAVDACQAQAAIGVPAQPAGAGVQDDALLAQALEPGAQQWRGLHVGGEHPPGAADEGVDAQSVDPGAQGVGVEVVEQGADLGGACAVAGDERRLGLGVGDVHPADPGEQELAPQRGHGIEQLDARPAGGEDFGGHQAGRAAADDGDQRAGGRGGHGGDRATRQGAAF